jgi:protoporphyrin/coproporphyrin ferrochelatase
MPDQAYDAILILSFGGPEKTEDVIPFLENVLRGRNVPRERMLAVAEHYYHFGGKSPINDHNRALIRALERELANHELRLPIYWGNRNWHPMLADTLRQMRADGIRKALAFVTSIFSSYSGCRQYLDDIARARAEVEGAPEISKLRTFYNQPLFIEAQSDELRAAIEKNALVGRPVKLIFTAHSIPLSMAETSDYQKQLQESCRLVADCAGITDWRLVYQSRSGPPAQPWLEPDIAGVLRELPPKTEVAVVPIGFVSDHIEVIYDLDVEAQAIARERAINMVRVPAVGVHPKFLQMIRELIEERLGLSSPRAVGKYPASEDFCPAGCCPAPARPVSAR